MRRIRVVLPTLALAAVFGLPAGAAQAASPPPAGRVLCYPQGASQVDCLLQVTAGSTQLTTTWSGMTFGQVETYGAWGYCTPNRRYTITVAMVDEVGQTGTASGSFICKGGPPI